MARSLQPYIDQIFSCNGTGAQELQKLVDENEVTLSEAAIIRLRVAAMKLLHKATKLDDSIPLY